MEPVEPVDVAVTVTVAFAVVVPTGLTAESVYTVVVSGITVVEAPVTVPTPLLMLVELAFETVHERTELCPAVIDAGVAVNDVIVGATCGATTVAEHVVVAIVEEASVAVKFIEYVPGETETVCVVDVALLPQRNVTGLTPPVDVAVHVIAVVEGEPEHVAVKADAAPTNANEKRSMIPSAPADKILVRVIVPMY